MKRTTRRTVAALGVAAVTGTLCVTAASPASAQTLSQSCPNSYECVIGFSYNATTPLIIDVDAKGGDEQPLAVSVDYTENCHPTIYPSQPIQSFTCNQMYPGDFTARVYGGGPHDYYIAVRLP